MVGRLAPNQKAIRVCKAPANKDFTYSLYNCAAMSNAMNRLSPMGFKVWCYMGMNQNGYEFGLSCVDVMAVCGIGRSSYYGVINELIEKGYLVESWIGKVKGYKFLEDGGVFDEGKGQQEQ